jgi:hypothetical protein
MGQKTYHEVTKTFLKGRKPGLFVNVDQFPFSWIRIRFPNADLDPIQDSQMNADPGGSGSTTLVETEANGDSKSTNEMGPSLFGSLGLSC